jgi:hypothetical protein
LNLPWLDRRAAADLGQEEVKDLLQGVPAMALCEQGVRGRGRGQLASSPVAACGGVCTVV